MKKLKFGDEKSIAYRDNQTIENIWERLKKKVVCPACKGKADSYFEWSIEEEWIGINFYC